MAQQNRKFISRLVVQSSFQLKYTLLVGFVATTLTAFWGYLFYQNEIAKTRILQIQNPELAQTLASTDQDLIWKILVVFLLQFLGLFFVGLVFTHRIAGPVYRLEQYLSNYLETGVLEVFPGVREKDEFHRVFDLMAEASKKLISQQQKSNIK